MLDDDVPHLFGRIPERYSRLRSGPPSAAVRWLVPAGTTVAVELGAGSGLATRELAAWVDTVYAVEPDVRMRNAFEPLTDRVKVLAGSAENIPFGDGSADAVFVFDAWHWFDVVPAIAEIARVLRPGGTLGVAWNLADGDVPWMAELFDVVLATRYRQSVPGTFVLPERAPFTRPVRHAIPVRRRLAPDEVIDLLGTYSAVLSMSPEQRAAFLTAKRNYLRRQVPLSGDNSVAVPFSTVCWRTQRL